MLTKQDEDEGDLGGGHHFILVVVVVVDVSQVED